jgi:hypothetical protein
MESIIHINNDHSFKEYVMRYSMNYDKRSIHYLSRRQSLSRHCFGAVDDYKKVPEIVDNDSSKWEIRTLYGHKCFSMRQANKPVRFKVPAGPSFFNVYVVLLQSWNETMASDIMCQDIHGSKQRITGYAPESRATQFIRVPLFQKLKGGEYYFCKANRPEVSCIETMIFVEHQS